MEKEQISSNWSNYEITISKDTPKEKLEIISKYWEIENNRFKYSLTDMAKEFGLIPQNLNKLNNMYVAAEVEVTICPKCKEKDILKVTTQNLFIDAQKRRVRYSIKPHLHHCRNCFMIQREMNKEEKELAKKEVLNNEKGVLNKWGDDMSKFQWANKIQELESLKRSADLKIREIQSYLKIDEMSMEIPQTKKSKRKKYGDYVFHTTLNKNLVLSEKVEYVFLFRKLENGNLYVTMRNKYKDENFDDF